MRKLKEGLILETAPRHHGKKCKSVGGERTVDRMSLLYSTVNTNLFCSLQSIL